VVYPSIGSGTSAPFIAHLNAVCTPNSSNISFTSTQTFASLFVDAPPNNFVGAGGNDIQVAATIGLNAALNGTVTGTS
jgi:hypothetical protein